MRVQRDLSVEIKEGKDISRKRPDHRVQVQPRGQGRIILQCLQHHAACPSGEGTHGGTGRRQHRSATVGRSYLQVSSPVHHRPGPTLS